MMLKPRRAAAAGAAIWLAALLAGCNLAGDITPPPDASFPQLQATPPRESTAPQPSTSPNLSNGRAIYADRCAPCHGEAGLGEGPQALDLPVQPAALADPELAASASPAEWYDVVTRGRMDQMMPPFRSLSEQERWDVVAYSLSLSLANDQLEQGRQLFQQECAECHNQDRPAPAASPMDDLQFFASSSRSDMARAVRDGFGEAMPGYADELSAAEIETVAAWTQALSWQPDSDVQPESGADTAGEQDQAEVGPRVRGRVLNATSGEAPSEAVEVTLHGFSGQEEVITVTALSGEDGQYQFDDPVVAPGQLLIASVDFQGVRYVSEVAEVGEEPQQFELPITVYESTNDPSSVRANQLHVLVDQPQEGSLQIVQLWVLDNTGERTVLPSEGQGGVEIILPAEARNLRFEQGGNTGRYLPSEAGFVLAAPLRPDVDEAQIAFSFELPYQGGAVLNQPVALPVAAVTLLVAEDGPEASAQGLVDLGPRQSAGERLQLYELEGLAAGERLQVEFGPPPLLDRLAALDPGAGWLVGILGLLLAAAVAAWWYRGWLGAGSETADPEVDLDPEGSSREQLLQAIADLDDAFSAGQLERAEYEEQRRVLKRSLIQRSERDD